MALMALCQGQKMEIQGKDYSEVGVDQISISLS